MAYHHKLHIEAFESYAAERNAEAALLFRRAAIAASEIRHWVDWYTNVVWAALATADSGDPAVALSLLIEAREREPEDARIHEKWSARALMYEITDMTRPNVALLRQLLDDLRDFATKYRVPKSDLLWLEGKFHAARGEFAEALTCYEAAWRDHQGEGEGRIKSHSAEDAAQCCLRLGRTAAARDWLKALASAGENRFAANGVWRGELSLRIALTEVTTFQKLLRLHQKYLDRVLLLQRDEVRDEARELTVRVHLLNSAEGEPTAHRHPARCELRRRRFGKRDVHARYSGRLLFLDYRLACLRRGAQSAPVDDFYYTKPQQLPPHLHPKSIGGVQSLLRKARTAANWAMCCARDLDGLLECDWRQREVQTRIERIKDLASLLQ